MPRMFGVDIPKDKQIKIALRYIYGIGPAQAMNILNSTNIDPLRKANDLTDEEIARITTLVQSNYRVEGELRRETSQNIRRLVDIGSYRGSRHKKGLPVRGQRTRCNSRTRKGPRPRVGGIKK
ncbi:MAG: 30S ribosomal protein S13 [Candidatus Omnitrophica bacterium]|nr:30S ribosomal protein S13 [Candidatus Omnitrophota bacterium]